MSGELGPTDFEKTALRPEIAEGLKARWSITCRQVEFAVDLPLERAGFEPSVPQKAPGIPIPLAGVTHADRKKHSGDCAEPAAHECSAKEEREFLR